jgi:lipopolysaccharide biosynthesis glycosyltransferase
LSNHYERSDIYVLVDETVVDADVNLLKRTSDVFSLKLDVITLDSSWKSCIPEPFSRGWSHVSPVAFAKLMAVDLLPAGYQRCLILDTDLMVVGSLSELLSLSLNGYPLAAVRDFMMPETSGQRLSLTTPSSYFNSGVLLIDVEKWKKADPLAQIASWESAMLSKITFLEQDILNIIFEKNYLEIDPCFNHMIMVSLAGEIPNPGSASNHPVIYHFPGQIKPWHEYCPQRIQNFYFNYANACRWVGMKLKEPVSAGDLKIAAALSANLGNTALKEKYSRINPGA